MMRQSWKQWDWQSRNVEKPPTKFGFEEMIISLVPETAYGRSKTISYSDAVNRDDAASWIETMKLEIDSLTQLKTRKLLSQQKDRRIIQTKWVYARKERGLPMIIRNETHLEPKEFSPIPGIDLTAILLPVSKCSPTSMMNSLSIKHKWYRSSLDVWNAFVKVELEEEIFLSRPKGFKPQKWITTYIVRTNHYIAYIKHQRNGTIASATSWNILDVNEMRWI